MTIMRIAFVCVICVIGLTSNVMGAGKDSSAFGFKYEGNALPSDAATSPRWERHWIPSGSETFYNSTADGILTIDTVKGPSPTESSFYYIPGQYSMMMNTNEEFYIYEDPSNPWNPNKEKGYTIEMRFRMVSTQNPEDPAWPDPRFAFWLQVREGQSSGGFNRDWQFFTDKIKMAGNVIYTGDLTSDFHVFRAVRKPNNGTANVFDLYLDGQLFLANAAGSSGAYDQDDISFGDEAMGAGGMDIKVEVDYLRFDLTGPYTPAYLASDLNKDLVTDFRDFAQLALAWLSNTNPESAEYVDCTAPANAGLCQ